MGFFATDDTPLGSMERKLMGVTFFSAERRGGKGMSGKGQDADCSWME